MTSLSFLPQNNDFKTKEKVPELNPKNDDALNFNIFNSVLFMNEYEGNEENISDNTNKENIKIIPKSPYKEKEKEKDNINNKDIKFSYSFEKCLPNELLNTITNDSNSTQKGEKLPKIEEIKDDKDNANDDAMCDSTNGVDSSNIIKISKNLFMPKDTYDSNIVDSTLDKTNYIKYNNEINKNTIYEESVNGFDYQLKFIEDSLHNVLPKSYKKNVYGLNNNYQLYNKSNQRNSSFNISNKFNDNYNSYDPFYYKNENNNNYNYSFVTPFDPTMNNNGYYYNNKKNKYQVHKLKVTDSNYAQWKCNFCNNVNRGYRKACINCGNSQKA